MPAKIFHPISITAILSSSFYAVSFVRLSSLPQHASNDVATCFRRRVTCFCRRRARRCLNTWRNLSAKNLYGYAAEEVLGQDGIELIVDSKNFALADDIVNRVVMGESWTGQFSVKNKTGEQFLAVVTNTPFYDDDGSLVGIIYVSSDLQLFVETRVLCLAANNAESETHYKSYFLQTGWENNSRLLCYSDMCIQEGTI
ncbi:uncharacterized protein LOC130954885 isoform X2 [Arachis stenosperma]|uniref:uncharacterized protein LOC130954885 isoform X2 n=1 Tax=Arachis stenosperma TaxID=217475 RepID=UPI0025ACDAA9|nr:uncharacterized protein LOC130954885 isoform X2 [Arachis stenosperma]